MKADIERRLEQNGMRARSSSSKAESRYGYDQHTLMNLRFSYGDVTDFRTKLDGAE